MTRPARGAVIAACVFAAVYIVLDLNKLWALRYGADTGAFVQWLNGAAHGRGTWNAMEARPHLQVHDSWGMLLLAPLVAIFPYAQTLLVTQTLAVAGAGVLLSSFARACGADARGAAFVAIAFLLSPSAQGLAYGNTLENVYVPILAVAGALAVRGRALIPALLAAQLLCALKEDQTLFVLWFGAACALWWDRRLGIALAALGAANGLAFVAFERLSGAQPSIPAYGWSVHDPFGLIALIVMVAAPFAFLPLTLGRRLLLALPLVAELAFAGPWAYSITRVGTHWTASIVAAASIAAAYAIAKRPRFAVPVLVCAVLCALTLNDTVLKIGRWPFVVDRSAYADAVALRTAAADVMIPRRDEGLYAVASANPHVRLAPYDPHDVGCPGYNRDARAFFASIGLAAAPPHTAYCGGAAVTSPAEEALHP